MKIDKFDLLVDNLRKRGSMYVAPLTYDYLINFLYGYDLAIFDFEFQEDGLKGMQELVGIKYGQHCALAWPSIIKRYFVSEDKEAIDLFFVYYEQLKQLRKEKGLQYLKDEYEKLSLKRKRKTNIYWPEKSQTNNY